MSLGDLQHVEAVSIMRSFYEETAMGGMPYTETRETARQWLAENQPTPEAYINAMKEAAGS